MARIQVPISEDTAYGRYDDALYYDEELWPVSQQTIDADKLARVNAWVTAVTTVPTLTLEDIKLRKIQQIQFAQENAVSAGITVNLPPYGNLILAGDALPQLLRDCYIADLGIRMNAAFRNTPMTIILADHSSVNMPASDVMQLTMLYIQAQKQTDVDSSSKIYSVTMASTINDVNAITP